MKVRGRPLYAVRVARFASLTVSWIIFIVVVPIADTNYRYCLYIGIPQFSFGLPALRRVCLCSPIMSAYTVNAVSHSIYCTWIIL